MRGVVFSGGYEFQRVSTRVAVLMAAGACGWVGARPGLAQTLSVEEVVQRMGLQTIQGATIITHGYQISDTGGDSLRQLAVDILNAVPGGGWLLDYEVVGGDNGAAMFDGNSAGGSINLPAAGVSGRTGHLVLLFDWAPESNELSNGWAEAAGDALFALLVALGVADPASASGLPLHFIAHSFGSGVNSECVERLAGYGVPVSQVTYLDPHDFDQPSLPVDEDQALFQLGFPAGYGAAVWSGVAFADTYYQTRGLNGAFIPDSLVPLGRPIPGTYNDLLTANELPSSYALFEAAGDHTYVWDCFYRGTVLGALPSGCAAPSGSLPAGYYTSTGWRYSPFAPPGQQVPDPAPVFYGAAQDHEWSNPALVTPGGEPNAAGLAGLGLTAEQVTAGGWLPLWDPLLVANHDFSSGSDGDQVAGWSDHGGGGGGNIGTEPGGNRFVELDTGDLGRVHNRLYVPFDAGELVFDLWRTDASAGDVLEVYLGNALVGSFTLDAVDPSFTPQSLPIPPDLRDTVAALTFEVVTSAGDSANVRIDNVAFALAEVTIVAASPPLDNRYVAGQQSFRDVLQTGSGPALTQGIGAAGTPSQDTVQYDAVTATFSGAPSPAPSTSNITVSCNGAGVDPCPTVTSVSGSGAGPYTLLLSGTIPPRNCTTLTFAGTRAGQRLQYQYLPGDMNFSGSVSASDINVLVIAVNNGQAALPVNLPRYNVNRGGGVSATDVARLVGLLNGVNTTQPWTGASVAACP